MTQPSAQGGDLLAWLDRAIDERERMAQESVEQATVHLAGAEASFVSVWRVVERPATGTFVATCDQWDRVAEVVPTYSGAHADHIAANDPAAVLRRCAADRKLIGMHGTWTDEERTLIGEPASDQSCKGCGFNNQEEPMVADYRHCPVLLALAEGYGWTADG